MCFYCVRVFNARYQYKFTITSLEGTLGRDIEERRRFSEFLKLCKKTFVDAGTHDVKLPWGSIATVVDQTNRTLVSFDEPEDVFWKYHDYVAAFGDPEKNGKGHTRQVIEGINGVLVPCSGPYKIRRSHQKFVDERRAIDDGSFTLGANQSGAVFADISSQLLSTRATGASLSSLLGPYSAPASSASSGVTSAASATLGVVDDGDDGTMQRFGFGTVMAETQTLGGAATVAGTGRPRRAASKRNTDKGTKRKAQPKEQSAPSAAVSKGRKPRDVMHTAERVFDEFRNADETSVLYFGDEWRRQRRWLERLICDLGNAVTQ